MRNDTNILYYTNEASEWNEALPIGNGRLGAMVFGNTKKERLALNLDELWSGFPRKCFDICIRDAIIEASDCCKNGEAFKATNIIKNALSGTSVQGYMPLGSLFIEMDNGEIASYSRSLSLENAINTTEYKTVDGNDILCESFASFPDKCIIWHTKSAKDIEYKISLISELKNTTSIIDNKIILDGECPFESPKNLREPWELNQVYSDEPSKRGVLFRAGISVISNSPLKIIDNSIVTKTSEVTVIFTSESSFNGANKHPFTEGKEYKKTVIDILNHISTKEYDDIREEHITDYSSFYKRTELDIEHDQSPELDTANRLKNSGDSNDIGLIILLYNYAKYLMISASREGSQAMNLQGIWNQDLAPAWNCNYTTNINTQMNYWPCLPFDLPEMNMPLIEKINGLCEAGKYTAKAVYGSDGFVLHYNSDLWNKTFAGGGNPRYAYWPMGSGWLCRHLYDHYMFTGDVDFLKETAYPIMIEAAKFYLENLITDPNGYYIMSPAASPELEYFEGENKCGIAYTSTMTMSIIRDLFGLCLKASKILNIKNELVCSIESILPKLLPTRVGNDGAIIEWYKEETITEPHHRHTSHLYGLYPAHEITIEKTPELIKGARKTLSDRGDPSTGWSMAWK
ncbi:MAG: glycoside hydrolase N-terminal domain-containing protein, partial [Clostridia bacterium]|nr:glycoside hydrolase N-terminal domain-containing protein [Clostridia bacterium]